MEEPFLIEVSLDETVTMKFGKVKPSDLQTYFHYHGNPAQDMVSFFDFAKWLRIRGCEVKIIPHESIGLIWYPWLKFLIWLMEKLRGWNSTPLSSGK